MHNDLSMITLDEASRLLREKKASPVELLDECLGKIGAREKELNAFIALLADSAREEAKAAEKLLARGGADPLCGIPFALKDLFYTKGVPTTAGSAVLADFKPDFDCTIATRLRQKGAVLMGKTNTHEWAYGATCDASHFGPSRNPWDPSRITGGSSGGSAAAVAAGMCYMAMGTDTGGSVRIPAGLCGIVGFKPTYGLASLHGVIPLSFSMDHPGPMTRSVLDAALVMDAITGDDPLDPCPNRHRGGATRFASAIRDAKSLAGKTIAIPENFFFELVDSPVQTEFDSAVTALEKLGARIVRVSIPHLDKVMDVSSAFMAAESAWSHRERMERHADKYIPEVLARIQAGAAYTTAQYIDAVYGRNLIRNGWEDALRDIDAVIAPSVGVEAIRIGAKTVVVNGREFPHLPFLARQTRLANTTGGPSLSVPCGFTAAGLPVGLMFMGRNNDDENILRLGYAYEKARPFAFPGL